MNIWKTTPILKVFIPFMIGLTISLFYDNIYIRIELIATLILSSIIINFFHSSFSQRWIQSVLLYTVFFFCGIYTVNIHNSNQFNNHYHTKTSSSDMIIGQIQSFPIEQTRTKFILNVYYLQSNQQKSKVIGKLQVHLKPNLSESPDYGDIIKIKGKIRSFQSPKNPNSFNYKKYMTNQGILGEVYVSEKNWQIIKQGNTSFLSVTNKLRNRFKKILEKYLETPRERSVGLALILGYKSELTKETKRKYAVTGSMHILAVSGLHVGLIFILLQLVLRNITSKKMSVIILKLMIQLLGIWIFVFITGASVSVIRAGIMFSFVVLGKSISLKTNTYNSILASAMFILLIDPMQIQTVGFQLSYLAVLSIIWLHPKIHKLLTFETTLLKYIWELTAISIAAQILVLPLGIYYFHQFPIYFWLSSWFVIPLATLTLYTAVLVFFSSFTIPFLTPFLGYLLYWIIWVLNQIVELIEKLPFNHIGNISIEKIELLIIYCIIFIGAKAIISKKIKWMTTSLAIGVIFLIGNIFQLIEKRQENSFTIYHVPNSTIIDHHIGQTNFSISNADHDKTFYSTQGNRLIKSSKTFTESIDTIVETSKRLHFKNFIFSSTGSYYILQKNKPINFKNIYFPKKLIVTDNATFDIENIESIKDSLLIIVDGSNHPNQNRAWELLCQIHDVNYYNVTSSGAYIE